MRTAAELITLAEEEPFPSDALAASTGKPQVILLFESVDDGVRKVVTSMDGDDLFVFKDRDLHWLPAGGFADSDLREVHKLVGLNTIRTMSTIRRLVTKL